MRAKLIYIVGALYRRVRYGPGDLLRRDRSSAGEPLPPRHLAFVGGGDFERTGREFLDLFVRLGGLRPDADVLDMGCGIGRMAIPLAGHLEGGSYRGFDVGKEMIRWCQKNITPRHPRFQFLWAPIYNQKYNPFGDVDAGEFRFPYEDDSFDFIFATSLFTHLVEDEVRHYLAEAARVLRPGGSCFLTFFLLDDRALGEVSAGRAAFDFSHPVGVARAIDAARPEEAIAYDVADLTRFLDEAGLHLSHSPYFGAWSNAPDAPTGQDVVVATLKR